MTWILGKKLIEQKSQKTFISFLPTPYFQVCQIVFDFTKSGKPDSFFTHYCISESFCIALSLSLSLSLFLSFLQLCMDRFG